jgi:hypothetical protein
MRFVITALALSLAAGQALAQTPAAPATPAPAAPTTAAPATPAPQATKPVHKRMTFTQRFEAANATHDGHLTKDQAKAAHMVMTVRHFAAIDKDHKGYLTMDDMRAYAAAQRAQHKAAAKPPA